MRSGACSKQSDYIEFLENMGNPAHAPYFLSLPAWASIRGMARSDGNRPSRPPAHARSVKTPVPSGRAVGATSRNGFGMPGMAVQQGRRRVVGRDDEDVGLERLEPGDEGVDLLDGPTLASKFPSSPAASVFLKWT